MGFLGVLFLRKWVEGNGGDFKCLKKGGKRKENGGKCGLV